MSAPKEPPPVEPLLRRDMFASEREFLRALIALAWGRGRWQRRYDERRDFFDV